MSTPALPSLSDSTGQSGVTSAVTRTREVGECGSGISERLKVERMEEGRDPTVGLMREEGAGAGRSFWTPPAPDMDSGESCAEGTVLRASVLTSSVRTFGNGRCERPRGSQRFLGRVRRGAGSTKEGTSRHRPKSGAKALSCGQPLPAPTP